MRKLLAILLTSAAACSAVRHSEYVLGAAGPWTQGYGKMNRNGIELALAEINAKGGIKGTKLRIEFLDDSGEGSRAVAVAQKFVDNASISAVIGHVSSGAMMSASKVYNGHIAAVATTATDPALTGISKWAFRVISSDSANGIDLAKAAGKLGLNKVSILYENDSYGRGLIDAFRNAFKGELLSVDPISGTLKDAEPYIAYLKMRRPDLVFVAGNEESALVLLKEAKKQNFTATFMGGDGWTGVVADPSSEGALVGAPFSPEDPRPAARDFVAAYRARYHADPDGNAACAYDATKLLGAALAAVGPSRIKIRDWLANLKENTAFVGATGPIRFRPDGDPIGKGITLTRVHSGKLLVEKLP